MNASLEKKSVLLVDDDDDLRAILRDSLEGISKNIFVQESPNGVDALMRAERQKFDLIITDLKMPKKNGVQLLDGLRRLEKSKRPDLIVVLSGCISDEGFDLPAGITRIQKPCTEEELRESVASVLPEATLPATPAQRLLFEVNTFAAAAMTSLQELRQTSIQPGKPSASFPEELKTPDGNWLSGRIPMPMESLGQELWLCIQRSWADVLKEGLPQLTRSEVVLETCQRIDFATRLALKRRGVDVSTVRRAVPVHEAHLSGFARKNHVSHLIRKLRSLKDLPAVGIDLGPSGICRLSHRNRGTGRSGQDTRRTQGHGDQPAELHCLSSPSRRGGEHRLPHLLL